MNIVLVYVSNLAQCEDGDVRLRGGNHYLEERVEVCRNQQWGRVCDDMWDKNDSAVVCRQLGFFRRRWIQIFSIPVQYHAGILVYFHLFWMMLDAMDQRATY